LVGGPLTLLSQQPQTQFDLNQFHLAALVFVTDISAYLVIYALFKLPAKGRQISVGGSLVRGGEYLPALLRQVISCIHDNERAITVLMKFLILR